MLSRRCSPRTRTDPGPRSAACRAAPPRMQGEAQTSPGDVRPCGAGQRERRGEPAVSGAGPPDPTWGGPAAAAMGQIRSIRRGLACDRPESPACILSRVDRVLTTLGVPTLATALLARIEQPADLAAARPGSCRPRRSEVHKPVDPATQAALVASIGGR